MFITFEGLDMSGKTTQALRVVAKLNAQPAGLSSPVRFLREPGGTAISERIREMLLDKENLEMTGLAELLLFSASRAQLMHEVIRPALTRGEIVVCDRYCDSTTAYQGYGRGIDLNAIRAINEVATGKTLPDLTVFVDIPVDEIEHRRMLAGATFDRMESSGREFYEWVRKGYHEIAAQEQKRFVTIDGTASIADVECEVWSHLVSRLESIQRERAY